MAAIVGGVAWLLIDGVHDKLTVTDATDYVGLGLDPSLALGYIKFTGATLYDNLGGGTPDIDNGVSPDNTSDIPLPRETDGSIKNGTYYLTYQVIYNGVEADGFTYERPFVLDYTSPIVQITLDVDCTNSRLTSRDVTVYPATCELESRVHTIQPPVLSGLSNQVTSAASNVYQGITTGPWQSAVESTILTRFEPPTVFLLEETIRGFQIPEGGVITCDTTLCKVLCCLIEIKQQRETARCDYGVNNPTYIALDNKVKAITENITYFYAAERCADTVKAALFLSEIKRVSGCSDNCNCSAGKIIPIVATPGTTQNFAVDSPDLSIDVTSDVVGNLTTFHVEVAQDIIDSIKTYVVAAGTNITVSSATVGTTTTFTVNAPNATGTPSNRYYTRGKIAWNPSWATPGQPLYLFTADELQKTGIAFKTPTYGLGTSPPALAGQIVVIGVSAFWATGVPAASKFTCQANIMQYNTGSDFTILKNVECEIFKISTSTDAFTIRLVDPSKSNAPLTFGDLNTAQVYYLQISIHADDAIVVT